MGVRSVVAVVGGFSVLFVMFRAFSVQSGRTTAAATNATNTSTYDGATAILDATATAGAQLPVVGVIAVIAGLLGAAYMLT
jgi:hypothetical protein